MEKSSAEGPVLLFVQTHEWKFMLSRTSIAGAFPLLSGSCVLTQSQLLAEWFPCLALGIPAQSPLPTAVTLWKNTCDLQPTGLFIAVTCKRAGDTSSVIPIPPINTKNHIMVQGGRNLWKQGWIGLLMSVSSPLLNICGIGVSTVLNCCELEMSGGEEWAVSTPKHSWILLPWLKAEKLLLDFCLGRWGTVLTEGTVEEKQSELSSRPRKQLGLGLAPRRARKGFFVWNVFEVTKKGHCLGIFVLIKLNFPHVVPLQCCTKIPDSKLCLLSAHHKCLWFATTIDFRKTKSK